MDLPSSCNNGNGVCASQIKAKHRGLCPQGFHIPAKDEWDALLLSVDADAIFNSDGVFTGYSHTAGKYLKATSGWDGSYQSSSGIYESINGTDDYGFRALPGGDRFWTGRFDERRIRACFWSASERGSIDTAYYFSVYGENHTAVVCGGYRKPGGFSVRCVKD
jgi:uncharacterized protein (TIGR02145 family)